MKIYCSGGKFYLQVPDTQEIRNGIDAISLKAEKTLWEEHKGQLSINIAYVPFHYEGEKVKVGDAIGKIGILWKYVNELFNSKKNQKFKNLILEDPGDFIKVNEVGGNVQVCEVTGIEGANDEDFFFKENGKEIKETLCVLKSVKDQIDKGIKLRDLQGFKMLEEYAGGTYLGVLRMDVDNLGKKFIDGFDDMDSYRKFSNDLSAFFDADKGNLHDLYEQGGFKECTNIVYAGGDDIFVVGRWDKTIEFAEAIRKEFAAYCRDKLKDNTLSISGGVAIVGSKFPIAKAAALAGEAEDAAKDYHKPDRLAKNAFNMFGESVSWEEDFYKVMEKKQEFVDLISKHGLSRSILHKIMLYAEMVKENEEVEQENKNGNYKRKPNYSYIWHKAYYLTRFMGKEKDNKPVYDFCKSLRDDELHTPEGFRLMSLAARWAELTLRINDNKSINK